VDSLPLGPPRKPIVIRIEFELLAIGYRGHKESDVTEQA